MTRNDDALNLAGKLFAEVQSASLGCAPGHASSSLEGVVDDPKLLTAIRKLYEDSHYPEAVEKAYKLLVNLVKAKSGIKKEDGFPLMMKAFSFDEDKSGSCKRLPVLAFNDMTSDTHMSEQRGMCHILAGSVAAFRNPRAHEDSINDSKEDADIMLSLANYLIKLVRTAKKL